jgi:hypothetical protein
MDCMMQDGTVVHNTNVAAQDRPRSWLATHAHTFMLGLPFAGWQQQWPQKQDHPAATTPGLLLHLPCTPSGVIVEPG